METRPKLTRDQIIQLIDDNGGPEGLDLSGYDLSNVNLTKLDLHGIVFGKLTIVKYADTEEITGVANLEGTWFERSNLQKANFGRANLRAAHFYQADLSEATLWTANADSADFRMANLSRADLLSTVLTNARLMRADLRSANLHLADLRGTNLSIESIGAQTLQESLESYKEYYDRWYISSEVRDRYRERHLNARLREAIEIYLGLKNAFLNAGRYDDASRAYYRERQLERKTRSPWLCLNYYGRELANENSFASLSKLSFLISFTIKWLLDWGAELSCGYGEKPLRTLVVAGVVLLAFPFLFRLSGGIISESGSMTWLDYFNYSLGAFTTIGFGQFQAVTPFAQTLTSIEALTGISILALLMFTLGNRISRS